MIDRPSHETVAVEVREDSDPGHARRVSQKMAGRLGFGEARTSDIGIVATELATNLVRHAGGGELLVHPMSLGTHGLELYALDRGRGMADVARCLEDGYSTAGSRGVGLGSMARLTDALEVYSRPDGGSALMTRFCLESDEARSRIGVVCVALPGEDISGDGWARLDRGEVTTIMVIDGLGHGPRAAEATRVALAAFEEEAPSQATVAESMQSLHARLHATRGASVALARIDWEARSLEYVGVGNISGVLLGADSRKHMISHNGTAGVRADRIQPFVHPWPTDGLLVMHSDGLGSRWTLDGYPGLQTRDPTLVAGVLYRDFKRDRDDTVVLALRERNPA